MEKKSIPIHTNQRRYAYSPRENYYDDGDYEEDTHKQTMECFECGSTFPHDEECPDCEVPQSSEEENHSSIKEETPETREYMKQRSPIYDSEDIKNIERKLEEMTEELQSLDNWTTTNVHNHKDNIIKLANTGSAIQEEDYTEQFEDFKTEVIKSLQDQVNAIDDARADAAHFDQEIQDLQEKTAINIGIKKEFKELKTEVIEQFQIHVDVIEQIKESVNEMVDERNLNKTEVNSNEI